MPLRQYVAHDKQNHNDNLKGKRSWNIQNYGSLESAQNSESLESAQKTGLLKP